MIRRWHWFYKVLIVVLVIFFSSISFANNVSLKDIVITTSKKDLLVYFNVEGCFTKKMEEAILNGLPVTFTFKVILEERRTLWPDKTVNSFKIYHTIKYDQLKGVFIINRSEAIEQNVTSKDFLRAKRLMAEVEAPVAPVSNLKKGHKYRLRLKAELEKVKLPLYLHYVFFFASLWDFETEWYNINFTY